MTLRFKFSIVAIAAVAALPGVGRAQVITGDITNQKMTAAAGTSATLSDNTAFASFQTTYPGDANSGGQPYDAGTFISGGITNTGAPLTDSGNVANFSYVSGVQDSDRYSGETTANSVAVSYTGANVTQLTSVPASIGNSVSNVPTSQTDNPDFVATDNVSLIGTSTLFAANEVYNFYVGAAGSGVLTTVPSPADVPYGSLDTFNAAPLGVTTVHITLTDPTDNNAVVGSYTGAITALTPPTNGTNYAGLNLQDLTLDITGAAVGDILTLNLSDTNSGGDFTSSQQALLSAVTADAVPEPSAWMLMLSGVVLLAGFNYRRLKV